MITTFEIAGKKAELPVSGIARATSVEVISIEWIVRQAGVCGGDACIQDSRIAVWVLEQWRRKGCEDNKILELYPALNSKKLKAAWHYVASRKDEIDKRIIENEDD